MNIIQLVSNKVWGGGEQYVLDLCRRLDESGNSVAVITRGFEAVDTPFEKAGFTPSHLPLGGIFDFISASRLSRVLDSTAAPVVVHAHNFKDANTAVRARSMMRRPDKVRIVVTRHIVKPGKSDSVSADLYREIDAIAFVSQAALDGFLEGKPKIDPAKLCVIHNAIAGHNDVVAADKADDELRLVYAGRLAHEKGIEKLIEAMPCMPNGAVLHVAGTGKPKFMISLRRQAAFFAVADRIVWHGHLSDPMPLMASADIGIVPTIVPEAFGLTVAEFMQQGVSVIATDNGGPREIITDGVDGILIPPGNAGAIRDAVARLANDPDMRREMGDNARQKIATVFDYDDFYKKILKLYDSKE